MLSKLQQFVETYTEELFLISALALVSVAGFGVGQLTAKTSGTGDLLIKSSPVEVQRVVEAVEQPESLNSGLGSSEPTNIVGNKNSKIYHRADCSGAQRMADRNKIYFASVVDAKNSGYRPAGNCPGLE